MLHLEGGLILGGIESMTPRCSSCMRGTSTTFPSLLLGVGASVLSTSLCFFSSLLSLYHLCRLLNVGPHKPVRKQRGQIKAEAEFSPTFPIIRAFLSEEGSQGANRKVLHCQDGKILLSFPCELLWLWCAHHIAKRCSKGDEQTPPPCA